MPVSNYFLASLPRAPELARIQVNPSCSLEEVHAPVISLHLLAPVSRIMGTIWTASFSSIHDLRSTQHFQRGITSIAKTAVQIPTPTLAWERRPRATSCPSPAREESWRAHHKPHSRKAAPMKGRLTPFLPTCTLFWPQEWPSWPRQLASVPVGRDGDKHCWLSSSLTPFHKSLPLRNNSFW